MSERKYLQRSQMFEYYVEAFPNSTIAQRFKSTGINAVNGGGSFIKALWDGNLDKTLLLADKNNTKRLLLILSNRTGRNYMEIEETDEIEGDGTRQQHWSKIMEQIPEQYK